MANAISILPDQQLAVLNDTYRKAVARKRLKVTLAAVVFFAALIVAAIGAEVNLRTLFSYFGNFVSYFDRILPWKTARGYGPISVNGSGAGRSGSRCSARPFSSAMSAP
jgi:ABC-type phosphate/phosphonate transport system permease subunit